MGRGGGVQAVSEKIKADDNRAVAHGAGLAFLGKLGALIEPISVILFANLYGAPLLGIFMLLWGYVLMATSAADLAMTTALQRYVPATRDEDRNHSILKAALLISTTLGILLALAITLAAPSLARFINADPAMTRDLPKILAIYAWAIPIWTFVEVSTAAVRARRAFGPEVKIRIFYEQGLRLVSGILFFVLGFHHYGLFVAHLLALAVAALLCLRLLGRHYDLKRLWAAPLSLALFRELSVFGLPMMGSNMLKRFHSNFPLFVLNILIPGAAGATAVAIYAVARKVVSALQVFRQSFEYVIAPLASARNALAGRDALQDMYAFATRLICSLFIPAAAVAIVLRDDIVALVGPEFAEAALLIVILTIGRGVEALTGPSQALLEMLARSRIPLINGIAGFLASAILMIWLTPLWGPAGAAVATAVGICIPSTLSLLQVRRAYGLSPYDRRLLRPVAAAFVGAALIAGMVWLVHPYGAAVRLLAGALGLVTSFAILLRFGYSERDAATFGRAARWLRH